MAKYTKPLESATRIKINNQLVNLGRNLDEHTPSCNCFTERAKTKIQSDKIGKNKPDYVLYESGTDRPIAIIEAKRQGKSLLDALNQAKEKYAKPLGVDVIFVTDGIFIQAFHVLDNDYLYYNGEPVTEFLSEKRIKLFTKTSKIFSEKKIVHSKVELIKIFKEANDILRRDGLSEGRERFTEFSNLLFLKLISDIENQKEESGRGRELEKLYCRNSYKDKKGEELMTYINQIVLPRFDREYNHSGDIFNKKLLINKSKNLEEIVEKIDGIGDLLDTNSDVKGDAFEYFLKNSISVGNDLGEYFTPRHIVKLMVELMDLKFEETIYDPCCGTGGFLIESFKNIKGKCKNTEANIKVLENKTVFGTELTTNSRIAKMNMIIMGDGHNNIKQQDCLENPVQGKYDVVLSNFAFSQKTDFGGLYGFDTTDANPIFLKHIFDSLNKNGRCAVVVPEGLLFDKNADYVKIRKILVEQANVEAVIKLHEYVFKPYTGQPTSIVIFNKGKKTEKVRFFDVTEDGYQKTNSKKGRRKIIEDDLMTLRQLRKEKADSNLSFSISADKIKKNNYQLSLDNYSERKKANKTVKLKTLLRNEEIIMGYTPSREDDSFRFGGKYPRVKISDLNDEMYIEDTKEKITDIAIKPEKILPKGTLLFSFKLSLGKVAITKKELVTNEAIAGLIVDDEIIKKYLYYILPTLDFDTNRATKGKTLNKDTVGDIDIPFDLKNIKEIVKKLDQIEDGRQKLVKEKNENDTKLRTEISKYINNI